MLLLYVHLEHTSDKKRYLNQMLYFILAVYTVYVEAAEKIYNADDTYTSFHLCIVRYTANINSSSRAEGITTRSDQFYRANVRFPGSQPLSSAPELSPVSVQCIGIITQIEFLAH